MSDSTVKDLILQELGKVDRPGISGLKNYITKESDFFTAPASSEHHLAISGGLAIHSWNVYLALKKICSSVYKNATDKPSDDSITITALMHDLCKANFYKPDVRNKKIEGRWVQVPYFSIDDKDPYGHGEKSVIILMRYIPLEKEEILAIRHHMGAWGAEGYAQRQCLSSAMSSSKFLRATMLADQYATYFMED